MTRDKAIAELVRIWHSPHLDLILKARLGEVIEAFKENNQSDSLVRDDAKNCKESESKLDIIRREDAITIPVMPKEHRQYQTMNIDDAYERGWYDLQDCIESLPSAEPKTGEWVRHELWDMPWYTCSECDFHGRNDYKFCPNCGSFNGSEEE